MKRLPLPLWLVFRTNLIKTILFNFRLLPISQAIKLPMVLIGKVNISGNKWKSDNKRSCIYRNGNIW